MDIEKLLLSVISVAFGAFIAYLVTNHRNRLESTFELHKEFHSEAMLKIRSGAEICLRKYPGIRFDQLESLLVDKEKDQAQSLWVLIGFYQRLWLAVKYRRIEKKLVVELFGELFYWWYLAAFQQGLLPTGWAASTQISSLKAWFDLHTTKEQSESWSRRALMFREGLESKSDDSASQEQASAGR